MRSDYKEKSISLAALEEVLNRCSKSTKAEVTEEMENLF